MNKLLRNSISLRQHILLVYVHKTTLSTNNKTLKGTKVNKNFVLHQSHRRYKLQKDELKRGDRNNRMNLKFTTNR